VIVDDRLLSSDIGRSHGARAQAQHDVNFVTAILEALLLRHQLKGRDQQWHVTPLGEVLIGAASVSTRLPLAVKAAVTMVSGD
jgi:hypothetical protein